jgi:hypothetical protein
MLILQDCIHHPYHHKRPTGNHQKYCRESAVMQHEAVNQDINKAEFNGRPHMRSAMTAEEQIYPRCSALSLQDD